MNRNLTSGKTQRRPTLDVYKPRRKTMNEDRSADVNGPMPHLLRLPAVLQVTGLGRSTLYKLVAEDAFPAPVKLAKRAVAWRQDDVRRWTSGRISTSHRQFSARGSAQGPLTK